MYAELQGSLVTQGEELLMQGRVETALSLDINAAGDDQKLPPPPPPKKGEGGYEEYIRRRAAEE